MKSLRVIHLLNSRRYSGAENVACQIIDMFSSDSSIKMYYCSPEGSVRQTVEEKGISYIGMPELSVSALKKAIFDIHPDIIHAHDMRAGVMASLCCGKIPLISHIHNNAFDSRGISLKSISYYLAARKAKHIFWVSRSAFEGYAFHKQLDKKSSILFNVININALQKKMNADEHDYTYDIVFLGRLTVPKNPERLIEVLERVIRKRPNTSIAIVGTGELDDVIKALVKEKGLLSNIQFLGFQSNPYKILHDAKLMIMTSRWEGTPMCALEAMALGVPIVSTPTDGLKDVVKNEITGYLSDSDDELSDYSLRLLTDNGMRDSFSKESISRAQKMMNIENYRENILMVYKSALKRK